MEVVRDSDATPWQGPGMRDATAAAWALEEFGLARLGDARRTKRLVAMAAGLAEHPGGTVTKAFRTSAERQGAYGLLEDERILAESLIDAAGEACARRCAAEPLVLVPVDGTSATLTDTGGRKGFGPVGPYHLHVLGLKVLSAIALRPDGTPLGLCAQRLWMQPPAGSARRSRRICDWLRVEQKQTQHWIDVIKAVAVRLGQHAPTTRFWFQIDRGGDAWPILQALAKLAPHWFTVRARNRRVRCARGRSWLRPVLARHPVLGGSIVEVPPTSKRPGRLAHLTLHATRVVLVLRDRHTRRRWPFELYAVWAHEVGTAPRGEAPLDWMLLTNIPVETLAEVQRVLDGYTMRWRLEDVHKTWKSAGCQMEASQLRSQAAVSKWATLLFTVAVRIERLKHLARTAPDQPASVELSAYELHALRLLKRKEKKRTETVPVAMPTIEQAVRWIADLGGYTGTSSGGPPGSITIRRGFERVSAAATALEALDEEAKGPTKM